jgi:hypothetical protein
VEAVPRLGHGLTVAHKVCLVGRPNLAREVRRLAAKNVRVDGVHGKLGQQFRVAPLPVVVLVEGGLGEDLFIRLGGGELFDVVALCRCPRNLVVGRREDRVWVVG